MGLGLPLVVVVLWDVDKGVQSRPPFVLISMSKWTICRVFSLLLLPHTDQLRQNPEQTQPERGDSPPGHPSRHSINADLIGPPGLFTPALFALRLVESTSRVDVSA